MYFLVEPVRLGFGCEAVHLVASIVCFLGCRYSWWTAKMSLQQRIIQNQLNSPRQVIRPLKENSTAENHQHPGPIQPRRAKQDMSGKVDL